MYANGMIACYFQVTLSAADHLSEIRGQKNTLANACIAKLQAIAKLLTLWELDGRAGHEKQRRWRVANERVCMRIRQIARVTTEYSQLADITNPRRELFMLRPRALVYTAILRHAT